MRTMSPSLPFSYTGLRSHYEPVVQHFNEQIQNQKKTLFKKTNKKICRTTISKSFNIKLLLLHSFIFWVRLFWFWRYSVVNFTWKVHKSTLVGMLNSGATVSKNRMRRVSARQTRVMIDISEDPSLCLYVDYVFKSGRIIYLSQVTKITNQSSRCKRRVGLSPYRMIEVTPVYQGWGLMQVLGIWH